MASSSVKNILIQNDLCQQKTGCKEGTLYSGSTWSGFYIELYGIVDPIILQKIVVELNTQYHKNDDNLTIIFRAYSESYGLKNNNPFMDITME